MTVGDDDRPTHHEVAVSRAELERFAPESDDPTRLVEASFRYLLQREPRESILRRFTLGAIATYFPSYAAEIGDLL